MFLNLISLVTIISIISFFLTILYAGLLLFFKKGWHSLPDFTFQEVSPKTKVSILIAARNEAAQIHLTIKDILAQTYSSNLYELIIVDDHSTDDTAQIIERYKPHGVKLIRLNESQPLNSYKKKAIAEAIKTAAGELIITTDADCRMSKDWLMTVVNYYEQKNLKLISSPVAYFEEKDHFEKLQTLEFSFLIGLGAAGIGNKMPSTCNGANLAYRKDIFIELGGFKGIDDLASGDDELFLHKVAAAYPNDIGFCKSYDAIVFTHAKSNLSEFIQQRKRWASKSVKYKDKRIIALAVAIWFFNLLLIFNLVWGIFNIVVLKLVLLQFLIKALAEFIFLKPVMDFSRRRNILAYLPALTIIHVIYFIYIGIAGNSGKYQWKERMVK